MTSKKMRTFRKWYDVEEKDKKNNENNRERRIRTMNWTDINR